MQVSLERPGATMVNGIAGGRGEEAGHHGGEVGGPAQRHRQLRVVPLPQVVTRRKTHITCTYPTLQYPLYFALMIN